MCSPRPGRCLRRELLLLEEVIDAAEQAHVLVSEVSVEQLAGDRQRRDALLWNFTVLGEASTQLPADLKTRFAEVPWRQPTRLRNRIVHGYWSIDLAILHAAARDQLPDFADSLRKVLVLAQAEEVDSDRLSACRSAAAVNGTASG